MSVNLKLKKANDFELFTPTIIRDNEIVDLDMELLEPYPNHPFLPYSSEKLEELADSIKNNGLISPIIVLDEDNSYFILSGHNRVNACRKAGLKTIKAIVKNGISKESADLIVVETNLKQRESLLPSEKAKAYKMLVDSLKSQGKRTDLYIDNESNSETYSETLNTAEKVANNENESRRNIYRFIRLNYLIVSLIDLVDKDEIGFRVGVELSYLSEKAQGVIFNYFFEEVKAKLDLNMALALREMSKSKEVNYESIDRYINGIIKIKNKKTKLEIPLKKIGDLLDDVEETKRVEYVMEALQYYKEHKNK